MSYMLYVIYYGSWLNRILRPQQKMCKGCQSWGTQSFYHSNVTVSLLTEQGEPAGRNEASESFNPFTLSDHFYDKAGRENRFGRICYYYSGFVSVVKFHILNTPLWLCLQAPRNQSRNGDGELWEMFCWFKQYSSVWSIFPGEITESEMNSLLGTTQTWPCDISHFCSCHWVLREQSMKTSELLNILNV